MIKLIFRKLNSSFFSIEKVFTSLLPYLDVKKIELPYESNGLWNRIKNISHLFKQKSDVKHITGHDHYLLWWPFKKAILTIHDIEALKRKKGIIKWLFKKLWFDIPIKNAEVITTISNFSKNEILSIGNYSTPIEVIYNPLTLSKNIYVPKEFNKLNPKILHIGVKKNKNLNRLLKAIEGINCKLIVIGKPSENISKTASELNIDIDFRFNLSDEEMIEVYYEADLLSFVSTYEGFGLPIIEAQAIGRAVITSNCSSMPEVAGEGAIMIDPFNIEDIRSGIIKLIEDDSLRNNLIKIGLDNVKRFQVEEIANQYSSLYKKVLSRK
jgi:glycosyltransferase involved in cell wall biosynthesis